MTTELFTETNPETVAELAHAFADVITTGWQQSPARAVHAVVRACEALAVRYIERQPEQRDDVLRVLRAMVDAVDAMTGVRH